ncbi:MAG: histidine--tRNA ligase [Gemmatimonadales bacterium]
MLAQALPGFRDFYPDDITLRNHIFEVWRAVAHAYGFEEYDGPPLESLDLYTRKSGDEIVGQLYAFTDKGDREVALRPEMTPTLARMVAARANGLKKPIRWFAIPQLFRYERQQRGRLREHFQFNMDLIGEPGPLADAEIIAAALDVLRAHGFGPDAMRARVSDRRVVQALLGACGVTAAQVPTALQVLDKSARDRREDLLGKLAAVGVDQATGLRVLGLTSLKGRDAVLAALAEAGVAPAAEPLVTCLDALEHMGLGPFVDVDLSIVRGLAYYTGVVFELFDAGKSLRAICGGGRYDDLLKSLGGADLPAVGFGMGDVVLGELLKGRSEPTPASELDAFLIAVTSEDQVAILALAHRLRDAGLAVEFSLHQQSVGKQLKVASSRDAGRAVLIGPDERAAGVALVRRLSDGHEERVPMDALVEHYDWT